MNARANDAIYRPSPVVLTGKAILAGIRQLLPGRVYRALYHRVDRAYRRSVRLAYSRFRVEAFLSGGRAARERTRAVHAAMPYSLVGWRGLEATYDAVTVLNRDGIAGALVECGVAQGGCAALMASTDARQGGERSVVLCDSYEGLPEPSDQDFEDGATGSHASILERGSCLGTIEQVSELLFDTYALDQRRIRLVRGWFEDTLPSLRETVGPIALLRIDADWYESVKCCLEALFDRVVPGGVIIVDDYGSCYGARRALDEFLAARNLHVELEHDGRGGCSFRKAS